MILKSAAKSVASSVSMQTIVLDGAKPGAILEAARLLQAGQLLAFPTDTLYGVGAAVTDEDAIRRLFEVKERPLDKGIPILLAGAGDVDQVAGDIPDLARDLMTRFWPGPLTIIVPRRAGLPSVLAPGDSVAVRAPDHELARAFISAAGGAVAATSANLSGQPPALDASQAMEALGGRIAAVLDGGRVHVGQASTIVDCTVIPPRIIRQGPIPAATLMSAVKSES